MGMPSMKYGTRQESSSNERLIDFKPHDTTNELIILKEEINELKKEILKDLEARHRKKFETKMMEMVAA